MSQILAKKYDFKKLYLFGSLTNDKSLKVWSDIDFAIENLKKELFLKAYADLLKNSKFPVDLKPFEELDKESQENIIKNGVVLYGEFNEGERWHRALLARTTIEIKEVRPQVISEKLAGELDDYLSFRHIFRNIYGFELEGERLDRLSEKFGEISQKFEKEIKEFLKKLKK